MAKKGRYVNTEPTPANFTLLWNRLHDLDDRITAHGASITEQADTLTTLQGSVSQASRDAVDALISAGREVKPLDLPQIRRQSGGGPPPPPPPPPPPGGGNFCHTQPLSTALPGWLYSALQAAGQTDNCWSAAMEASIEGTFNANDWTIVSGLACSIRGRIFHQGNHGLWTTCGGHPDAQYHADIIVDAIVTNPDGSVSWGWVPH